MGKKIVFIIIVFSVLCSYLLLRKQSLAAGPGNTCGNGVCQVSQGEDVNTCPADCGSSPTATPVPPTPIPPTAVPPTTIPPTVTSVPPSITPTTPTSTITPEPSTYSTSTPAFPTSTINPTLTDMPTTSVNPTSGVTTSSTITPGVSSSITSTASEASATQTTSSLVNEQNSSITYPIISLRDQNQSSFNSIVSVGGTVTSNFHEISYVEYSIDNGNTWNKALSVDGSFNEKIEDFLFTLNDIGNGSYTISVRAGDNSNNVTPEEAYGIFTFIVSQEIPRIILDPFINPISQKQVEISGEVVSPNDLVSAQYSLDSGINWSPLPLNGNKFKYMVPSLSDGNYQVVVRVTDNVGNVGLSEITLLIIDTSPPIIGGMMFAHGSQTLSPDSQGVLRVLPNITLTLALSTRGGVTDIAVNGGEEKSELQNIDEETLWKGDITFTKPGVRELTIIAHDGAGNVAERKLIPIVVEHSGAILDSKGKSLENINIELFYKEPLTQAWTLWDGSAYGQLNPQSSKDGLFSYSLPKGRYYMRVKYKGKTYLSRIYNLSIRTLFNPKLQIKDGIFFFGNNLNEVSFMSKTYVNQNTISNTFENVQIGGKLPSFELPNNVLKMVSSEKLRGKKTHLVFLSTWSPQAAEQAPILSQESDDLDSNEQLLTIFVHENSYVINSYLRKSRYKFDALADDEGISTSLFDISLLPMHYYINSDLTVNAVDFGLISKDSALLNLNRLR